MRKTLPSLAAVLLIWPAVGAALDRKSAPEIDPNGRVCLEPSRGLIAGQDLTWFRRLEAKPNDSEALQAMTLLCLDRGKTWAALAFADRWTAVSDMTAQDKERAHVQAGEIRVHLGYFAEAEKDFKSALELNADNSFALRLLAASKRDKPKEALAFAEKAAKLDGPAAERAAAYLLEGELRSDLGDRSGAANSFSQALKLSPGDLDGLAAMVVLKRGEKTEALPYAERAEGSALKAPLWLRGAALRHSARTWLALENFPRAGQNLRRALELNAYDLDALVELVKLKEKPGQQELLSSPLPEAPALSPENYSLILKENPYNAEALRGLATAALASKDGAAALVYAERLARAVWKTPAWQQAETYRLSAKLWLDLKRPRRAYESADQALDIQPDSVETMDLIILFEKMIGDDDDQSANSLSYIYYKIAEMRVELKDFARAEESMKKSQSLGLDGERAARLKESIQEAKLKK